VHLRPPGDRDERGISFLPFASSAVERFFDPAGRLCPRLDGRIRDNLIGWRSANNDPVCIHDTVDDGQKPAVLELRWRSEIPADGNYDLVTLGYSVGTYGTVLSRGAWLGDYVARAELHIDAQATHCSASRSFRLASASVNGPIYRGADYSGWTEIPSLILTGCKAHEPIEVRVRLVGESNRGRIEVDWFGIAAASDEEVNRIFGLRLRPELPPPRAGGGAAGPLRGP
jgi:hypothetical protein